MELEHPWLGLGERIRVLAKPKRLAVPFNFAVIDGELGKPLLSMMPCDACACACVRVVCDACIGTHAAAVDERPFACGGGGGIAHLAACEVIKVAEVDESKSAYVTSFYFFFLVCGSDAVSPAALVAAAACRHCES